MQLESYPVNKPNPEFYPSSTSTSGSLAGNPGGNSTWQMPVKKVLLVQADREFSRVITQMLTAEGFEVLQEFKAEQVKHQVSHYQPDLVILDVLLPGNCGLLLCRELRRAYNGQLLFLSSKTSDIDQVLGLEVGADAYITKPVALRVLLAKIKAMFRWQYQQKTAIPAQEICCGELAICRTSRQVYLYRQPVELTGQEFDLLWLLASRAGEVQDRNVIYQLVAGRDYDGLDRSIDVRISRLRKKLADDLKSPFRIKTVRGQGYMLVANAWN